MMLWQEKAGTRYMYYVVSLVWLLDTTTMKTAWHWTRLMCYVVSLAWLLELIQLLPLLA